MALNSFYCNLGLREYCVPKGWEINTATPLSQEGATERLFQGTVDLPVTFFTWEEKAQKRGQWDRFQNKLVFADDPFNVDMFITYGMMTLYDTDQMIQAHANQRPLANDYYYDAYWFTLNTRGTNVAMRDGEIVLQYMALESPTTPGFYEQFSCVGRFSEKTGIFDGDVYNYGYSNQVLDAESAISNGDNIDFQTFYHPLYERDGPWSMAASEKFYTTYYAPDKDQTGISCTGVRQEGSPNGARFGVVAGDIINVQLGYRVYVDENDTVPRHAEDFEQISFELLGGSCLSAALGVVAMLATTTF